jgi:hypothetical protein
MSGCLDKHTFLLGSTDVGRICVHDDCFGAGVCVSVAIWVIMEAQTSSYVFLSV